MECLNNVIGFTKKDCSCHTTDRPTDYATSASGLYLDQFANISALLTASDCGSNMWAEMAENLELGKQTFLKDINLLLSKRYRLKRKQVEEVVLGTIKGKNPVDISGNYSITRMVCAPVKSGYMVLKKIGTIFENVGTKDIHIYNNVQGFIQTVSTSTLSNSHQQTSVDVTLPLFSKYVDVLEYYFIYEVDAANRPKDNELTCGCGGWTPFFNMDAPYFWEIGTPNNSPWSDYVMIGTGKIDSIVDALDVDGLDGVTFSGTAMQGLTFELGFKCLIDEVICSDALDFTANIFAKGIAFAILYATAMNVAQTVLTSTDLDRENLLNLDQWIEDKNEWQEKYNEHVNYIAENIDISANDCLSCQTFNNVIRGGLFA